MMSYKKSGFGHSREAGSGFNLKKIKQDWSTVKKQNMKTPLEVAITQVGQKEDPIGSNWGHPVQDYLLSVGINFPASWCMAFVYWCFQQSDARVSWGQAGRLNPLVHTGGVIQQWKQINPNYKKSDPKPGDVFIMDFGGGLGHTGFIESVDGNVIHTIEGNTNDSGGREGYEVCARIRHASKCIGFIRFEPESV